LRRLEESRFLKKEIIFPGLFDFSGAFLSDLKERMESLPVNQAAIGAEVANPASSSTKIANCKSSKEPAVNNISSSNSSSNNSGSSSSSSNGHSRDDLKSAIETSPGDDCNLSDGEVEDDTTLTRSQDTNKVMGNHEGNLSKKRKNNTVKRSNADQHSTEDNNDVTEEYHEREVCGLTRYEASKYFIKVTSVLDGGQEELINTECALLCTIQSTTDKQLKSSNGGCVDTQKEKGKEKEKEKESNSVTDDFTIGRSRSNHCPLDDLSVSKSHAIISYYQGVGFILRDLKSKHGTFLDGVRLGISDPGSAVATVEVDKRGCDTSAVGGSGGNVKGGSNRGFLLQDGSVVQFGRVVCTVYKKRQSAVISSG
jgi:FHA domain